MQLSTAIQAFLDHRRQRRRQPGTIEQYEYHLDYLWRTWRQRNDLTDSLESVNVDEIARYFHYLEHEHVNQRNGAIGLAPATRDAAWRVLRSFWRYCARRKWLDPEQVDLFQDDEVLARPRVDHRIRPALEDKHLEALLQATLELDGEERAMAQALLLVLAESGARISEIANLELSDVNLRERCARIIGKGNREEWIFWRYRADRALREYLKHRGNLAGPLFRSVSGRPLGTDGIRSAVRRLANRAGIDMPKGALIHCFRHRFAHKAIEQGLDVTQVAQLMRHRNIETTYRYLRESKERLRQIRDRMGD